MEAGIESYGAYIPIYRLEKRKISEIWGGKKIQGEKAIANADEDSLTMGVAAGIDCMRGIDSSSIDGLYFASTSAPYREKSTASIIASALDLREDIVTADFCNSIGSGAKALRAAFDAVNARSARKVLVITSDCRIPPPNSSFEMILGDGAAALLVSSENLIATVEGYYSVTSSFLDTWKRDRGDTYFRTWEDRFVIEKGYLSQCLNAVGRLFEKYNMKSNSITKAAFYAPDSRSHKVLGRKLNLNLDQIQDPLFDVIGNTGTAFFIMILVAVLEKSKGGEKVLSLSYGDGADVWFYKVTDRIGELKDRRGIEKHITSKISLSSYGKYIRFRDLMKWEATPYPPKESSLNVFYREEKALIRGYGQICNACGHIQFPPQRICMWCQEKDQFKEVKVVDKRGKLFTFSVDDRAVFSLDLPNVLVIVDLEGGGRIYNQATDRKVENMKIGMEMEFTFRKFHEGAGFHNYSWKMQPVRC